MSAIWGLISNTQISEQIVCDTCDSLKDFVIDNINYIIEDKVMFGCGLQYFTKESINDRLPFYDKEKNIIFNADCYISNREQLIDMLEKTDYVIDKNKLLKLGDAMLAFIAFKVWGERFVDKLRGDFVFSIYDKIKDTLLIYTDHLARRYICYYIDEDKVCYSTTYQTMKVMLDGKLDISKKWIAASFSDCTADTLKIPGMTVYDNIFHIEPGHYLLIDLKTRKVKDKTYWMPLKGIHTYIKATDEQFEKLLKNTIENATNGLIRTSGNVGVMLSSGLDSSTVAGFASKILKKDKKNLYSYTSVPADDYKYNNSREFIENEKQGIIEQCNFHKNIVPHFVGASDKNCFTNLKVYTDTYMQPIKPIINMGLINTMYSDAAKDGCKIMLSGQNGNATISYGNMLTFVYQKICKGQFIDAYRQIEKFCDFRGISKKRFIHVFINQIKEKFFNNNIIGDDCFIDNDLIKQYKIKSILKKVFNKRGTGLIDSVRQRRNFIFMPLVFQHMGFFDTYNSLKYGVLSHDPTLTVEVIELCLRMPIDCFVHNGKERRAVRDYMREYIPECITESHIARGVQCADFDYRVNRDWDVIKKDVIKLLKDDKLREYLDEVKIDSLLNEIDDNEYNLDKTQVAKMAILSSLSCFLNCHDN